MVEHLPCQAVGIAGHDTPFADRNSPSPGESQVKWSVTARHRVKKLCITKSGPTIVKEAVGRHRPGPGKGCKNAQTLDQGTTARDTFLQSNGQRVVVGTANWLRVRKQACGEMREWNH